MNKKDLANIRKEFKLGSYMLPIKEVYSVYLKKDNGEIITRELEHFEMMEIEKRELYLNNFKKVLTGSLDSKIFELDFKETEGKEGHEVGESTQQILYGALNSGKSAAEFGDKIVDKISKNYTYDTDVVINFIKAEYYNSRKNKNGDESDVEDYVQAVEFILCSVNKVEIPKKVLKFDYTEMKFKPNSALDMIVNLNSPLDGFMFPSFTCEYVDVNKIIYYSSKTKQVNGTFVEKVLECTVKPTAVEEKESFKSILGTVTGGRIKPDIMKDVYERINEKLDGGDREEEAVLDVNEVTRVLKESGLKHIQSVKSAFQEVCGGDHEFKARNVIPDFKSKSVKIENENTSIIIRPQDLGSVKQVIDKRGKKCLLIELKEDMVIDGLNLETEKMEDYI
ncbi:DUF4317 domain-containing protein [Clostridium sp. HV4-5-A1G]|jgi:hypothetical protein|uniref:DUF4317 domain-containing protein n=1 Tax=Clostridium sp. HV4-5-A1G TaxID=2004595 RepID=UPI0012390ABD|nr:DUF4317 domain-containing protein [Clostridium sp. HV4-5-A1G]KAA8674362.1 DUF4317 family protein [Clostridium sp. HV4-5-A1G]